MTDKLKTVCVVGAGVIGLSTAVHIIDTVPQTRVVLIADKFSPNTTSDVAGGFWSPYAFGDTPKHLILKWGRQTWDHLYKQLVTFGSKETGIQMISGYELYKKTEHERSYQFIYPRFELMTQTETDMFECSYGTGVFYTTLMCQYLIYSTWLMKRFQEKGGLVLKKKLNNLDEIYMDYDVIVNCSGLGANKLVNDTTVQPIRGQIIKVHAPWVKHFYNCGDGDFYIFPGQEFVVLGGTCCKGEWSTEPTEKDRKTIWDGCCKLLPSIKDAKIVGEAVGLRPGRHAVRLETEIIDYNGQKKFLVHNYGHGGSGVTLHWGCAVEATQLVRDCLGRARL